MKTLLILSTHTINERVICEYLKMKNTKYYDSLLFIDNNQQILNDGIKKYLDIYTNYLVFDHNIHDKLKLPYVFTGDWSKTQWYNADYRLYYLYYYYNYKYDFYWQFDYDTFFNSESNTYSEFLTQYNNNENDFIVRSLCKSVKNSEWNWSQKIDWCYDDNIQLYGCFFL